MPTRLSRRKLRSECGVVDDPPEYVLGVHCMACRRDPGEVACKLCCAIEFAEESVTGVRSPGLRKKKEVVASEFVPSV